MLLACSFLLALAGKAALATEPAGHLVNVGTREAPLGLWTEERGTGEPILMIHGFGANTYTWRKLAPALARTHRIISIDLKGSGRSDKPLDDGYSVLHHVPLLLRLIDRKGLTNVTLVGNSYGGGVALALAAALNQTRPGVLKRLILIDSIAYRQRVPLFIEVLRTPVVAQVGIYAVPPEVEVYKGLRAAYYDASKIGFDQIQAYAHPLYEPAARHALLKTAELIIPPQLPRLVRRYRTIHQPALILWGAEDRVVPLWVGRRLARDLPNARLAVIDSCGHAPQEECPAQTLALIRGFMASAR